MWKPTLHSSWFALWSCSLVQLLKSRLPSLQSDPSRSKHLNKGSPTLGSPVAAPPSAQLFLPLPHPVTLSIQPHEYYCPVDFIGVTKTRDPAGWTTLAGGVVRWDWLYNVIFLESYEEKLSEFLMSEKSLTIKNFCDKPNLLCLLCSESATQQKYLNISNKFLPHQIYSSPSILFFNFTQLRWECGLGKYEA